MNFNCILAENGLTCAYQRGSICSYGKNCSFQDKAYVGGKSGQNPKYIRKPRWYEIFYAEKYRDVKY